MAPSHGKHRGQESGTCQQNRRQRLGVRKEVSPCVVCAIRKITLQPHPTMFNPGTTMPVLFAYTDLMGPISPLAMRGFKYASKTTDEFTKYKVIYSIQTKEETVDTIQHYMKSVVAPLGNGIQDLRTDIGT